MRSRNSKPLVAVAARPTDARSDTGADRIAPMPSHDIDPIRRSLVPLAVSTDGPTAGKSSEKGAGPPGAKVPAGTRARRHHGPMLRAFGPDAGPSRSQPVELPRPPLPRSLQQPGGHGPRSPTVGSPDVAREVPRADGWRQPAAARPAPGDV